MENPLTYCAVTLPPGLVGLWDGPPLPFHGFSIPLEGSRSRRIHLQSYATTMESEQRLESLADLLLRLVRLDDRRAVLLSRKPTTLAGLPALRQVVAYRKSRRRVPYLEDQILVLRWCSGEPARCSHLYTLILDTPRAFHSQDVRLFETLAGTWEFLPAPDRAETPNALLPTAPPPS